MRHGTKPLIAVLDYGMGNRRSVQKALEHVGASVAIAHDPQLLEQAAGVIVPGVGAFPQAIQNLHERDLVAPIQDCVQNHTPLLGICLGMQLLFDRSEEIRPTPGLGLIAGSVSQLQTSGLRVPHIGWNEVRIERFSPLTRDLPLKGCPFYHVHSLAVRPRDPGAVVGTAEYGERFATIVAQEHVFGVQFHPEKSSAHGLRLLGNFVELCARREHTAVAHT